MTRPFDQLHKIINCAIFNSYHLTRYTDFEFYDPNLWSKQPVSKSCSNFAEASQACDRKNVGLGVHSVDEL
jgi:hypothetical protein